MTEMQAFYAKLPLPVLGQLQASLSHMEASLARDKAHPCPTCNIYKYITATVATAATDTFTDSMALP
jgi:hypothetical protein